MKHDEAPALLALGAGDKEQIVNYRFVDGAGDRVVADKVLRRAILISGVGGDQQKVEITHQLSRTPVSAASDTSAGVMP